MKKFPQDLIESFIANEVIAVVGSGLSIAAGLPSWKQSLELLINECEKHIINFSDADELKHLLEVGAFPEVADECRKSLGKPLYRDFMQRMFRPHSIHPTSTHKLICDLPFSALMTTNYDMLLEQTCFEFAKSNSIPPVYTQKNVAQLARLAGERRFFILKLHGDVDDIESIILTRHDYQEIIHNHPAYHVTLSSLLATRTLLFIGYGLKDPDFDLLLAEHMSVYQGFGRRHFLIDMEGGKVLSRTLQDKYNISVIPYNGSQAKLEVLLSDLKEQIDLTRKAPVTRGMGSMQYDPLSEQLRQSQRLESLGTLAGGIAHDFNNILAIILLHAEFLKQLLSDRKDNKIDKSLDAITTASNLAATLIRQILSFARRVDFELIELDPVFSVNEVVEMLKQTFPPTIEIKMSHEQSIWKIQSDQTQFHQVMLNLCVNAWDAMTEKGGSITIMISNENIKESQSLTTRMIPPGEYVKIAVTDTGVGMDEETKARIFEPFFTTKESGKGTGLGLAVVYGILKSHGGFTHVLSEVGQGSTFELFFPKSKLPPAEVVSKDIDILVPIMGKILVVEDDSRLRETILMTLQQNGIKTLEAGDGEEAINIYSKHRGDISVVVMDMVMPKLNGPDAARAILEINESAKIIMMSGYYDEHTGTLWRKYCTHFIPKPFVIGDLVRLIHVVVNQ